MAIHAIEKKVKTQINPKCHACVCYRSAKCICLAGKNVQEHKRLVVFTDYPDYFADNSGRAYSLDTGRILDWMFRRMSIPPERVAYDYTLRCYAKDTLPTTKADRTPCIEECAGYRFKSLQRLQPKAIVVLGTVSLEAFTGKTQIGSYVGRRIKCWEPVVRQYTEAVWVGYSLQYVLASPSDTPGVFRVLYMAAQDAGLEPKLDPDVPPFQWRRLLF